MATRQQQHHYYTTTNEISTREAMAMFRKIAKGATQKPRDSKHKPKDTRASAHRDKKNDDCYFYYYSKCEKENCPYRHEPASKGCEIVCNFWKKGNCTAEHCGFRHLEPKKQRSLILCHWENQPSGCTKDDCAYMHRKTKDANRVSNADATESLIKTMDEIRLVDAKDAEKRAQREREDSELCCVCTERRRDVVLVPCGHTACCEQCAKNPALNNTCPICRAKLTQIMRAYLF